MPSSHEIDFKARCPRSLTPSGARVRTHLPDPPSTMLSYREIYGDIGRYREI